MDTTKHRRPLFLVGQFAIGLIVAGAFAACGSDDTSSDSGAAKASGNGTDRAFVAEMIPHHESAVEMAEIAEERARSTFVIELAGDIIGTQKDEITRLKAIASQLDADGIKATSLGVVEHQMGMDGDMSKLKTAKPFDRAFIDMMIPHHQGAIRMARAELAKGSNVKTKQLATQIIAAQAREIRAMNKHRTEEFGAASPAGGVPANDAKDGDATDDAMTGMNHG